MSPARGVLAALLLFEIVFFFHRETTGIIIETPLIRDPVLAAVFKGVRVAQVSDLHITRYGTVEQNLVTAVNRADPDILFVTGDLVSEEQGIDACAAVLGDLRRDRTVIAVPGNNDYPFGGRSLDTSRLLRCLRERGIIVLRNQSVQLTVRSVDGGRERSIYVTGLDDNFLWKDDIFAATRRIPAGSHRILLAHAPNIIERIQVEHIRLILSGHTHGGQIVIPLAGVRYTNAGFRSRRRYIAGLYEEETKIYVNRGIGTVLIPLRFNAPPELTVFTFTGEGPEEPSGRGVRRR